MQNQKNSVYPNHFLLAREKQMKELQIAVPPLALVNSPLQ